MAKVYIWNFTLPNWVGNRWLVSQTLIEQFPISDPESWWLLLTSVSARLVRNGTASHRRVTSTGWEEPENELRSMGTSEPNFFLRSWSRFRCCNTRRAARVRSSSLPELLSKCFDTIERRGIGDEDMIVRRLEPASELTRNNSNKFKSTGHPKKIF